MQLSSNSPERSADLGERFPTDGEHRLVVRSIGSASPKLHTALARVLPQSSQHLLGCLYRAPAVLVDDISEQLGEHLCSLLGEAGLELELQHRDEPFVPGQGDREVAVFVDDVSRFRELAAEVAQFLGCELGRAAATLWASPALLVGSVSDATVDALRARLEPLGAQLDVSSPATARYDLLVVDPTPGARARVLGVLRALGLPPLDHGPLVARDLDRDQADAVWARLDRGAPVRMLDQAFQRFDVRLDAAHDGPALRRHLVERVGMPAKVLDQVLRRLPVVLDPGVRHCELAEHLHALTELGAQASAHLVTFQTFDLVIDRATNPTEAAQILATLTERPAAELVAALRRPPVRIDGPFPAVRARWMQHELRRASARARLEER